MIKEPLHGCFYSIYQKSTTEQYRKLIQTSATSENLPNNPSYGSVDFTSKYWYGTGQKSKEYLTIYLPHHSVDIEGYLIQTSPQDPGCHPRHWSFAVSDNGENFFDEEVHIDVNNHMNHSNALIFLPFKHGRHQYFRLNILGASYCSGSGLTMDVSQIELFGTLYSHLLSSSIRKHQILIKNIAIFLSIFMKS